MEVGVVAAVVIGLAAVFSGKQGRLPVRVRRRRRDPHPVVGGPAMAAEDEGEQRLVRLPRLGRLLGDLQVAVGLGFERAHTVSLRVRNWCSRKAKIEKRLDSLR